MRLMKKLMISGLLLALGFTANAQVKKPEAKVLMIAKPRSGAVLLRWAPDKPLVWKYANTYGYTIERYTILRKGQTVSQPEKVLLTQQPLKPKPLPAWEKVADTSDYGAIVALALYGPVFKTDISREGNTM